MVFKKRKKKETEEELKAKLAELESETEGELQEPAPPKPPKKETKVEESTLEVKGDFSLNESEMALAVDALARSEEFKLYQQMVIGQQAAEIIATYNKVVGGKSGMQPEDADEEELPKAQ